MVKPPSLSRRALLTTTAVSAVACAGCMTSRGAGDGGGDENSLLRLQFVQCENWDDRSYTLKLLVDVDTKDQVVEHWATHEIAAKPDSNNPEINLLYRVPEPKPSKFRVYSELANGETGTVNHRFGLTFADRPTPENPCAYTQITIRQGDIHINNKQMEESNC